ncbi:ABI protein family member 3-like isoform X1 [Solea senegalensis]|uniref:ABI protein family member 3-like isoform X1 n=1 Tax=Solea senegalensis TaxID=28829 RepID=A0AAV6RP04_SOLSE|nr:abl interactor 1-like [Solea senegalensis]KAG7506055.1 ABI protein family member 3-like isoform X1 [Solea senegalensis]
MFVVVSLSSSFGKPVAPPIIPTTCEAPPEDDIMTLVDYAPPPPPLAPDDEIMNTSVPPPPVDSLGDMVTQPSPSPPQSGLLTNHNTVLPAPPLILETVVEENLPPPPSEDDVSPLTNDVSELPALPPPPPPIQEVDVTLPSSRRSRRRRSPPTTRSLSLRVRSGPASHCRFTRSLFLPAVQSLMIPPPPPYPPPRTPYAPPSSFSSPQLCLPARLQHLDLEIPAPPPSFLLDTEGGLDDILLPLPPPLDCDDTNMHILERVVVLYNYEASKPGDLTLTEGEIVHLTRRHDDGWCEGFLDGRQGFFPESYVTRLIHP